MENYVQENVTSQIFESKSSKSKFYSQIFLYFGLGILLTAVTCILVSVAFSQIWPMSIISDGIVYINEESMMAYTVMLIVSFIALFVLSLVITFKSLKNSGSLVVPYVLYSIVMGIMLSSVSFFVGDLYIIGEALLITALLFLGMCGVGYLTHNKLATWAKVMIGLSIFVVLFCLLNFVLIPFTIFGGNYVAFEASMWIYMLTEVIVFALFLVLTAFDMARIRKIAENGAGSKNIALYCALNLYCDFINLFIYVLRILILLVGSSRNN